MPPRIWFRIAAVVLALVACGYALAIAQPGSSKKGAGAAAKEPADTKEGEESQPAPAPATAPSPRARARSGATPNAQPTPGPMSPGEAADLSESPLLVEPKTPNEFFDAAVLTDRLYRPGLTRRYLEKLLALNPSDATLLEMRDKYGPAVFLSLAHNRALQPLGSQLLERVTAALRKHNEDPAFLDSLIRGLQASPEDRDTAIEMLTNIGPGAVPRILQHIAVPSPNEDIHVLITALSQLGNQVVPVLEGALESSNDSVRAAAIQALGLLHSKAAVPYLLDPAFDPNQPSGIRSAARTALARILGVSPEKEEAVTSFGAATELKKFAGDALANRLAWPTTDGKTDLWTWNEESKTVVVDRLSPASASLYIGLRFARQALAMEPEDRQAQVLFLALDFAWSGQGSQEKRGGGGGGTGSENGGANAAGQGAAAGREMPHEAAMMAGADVVSDTLALGLKVGNPSVAIGALDAMAAVGARQELYGTRRLRSPLMAALNSPNPDVQYAAAVAILRANPQSRFRGSERVVQILTRAISGTHTPLAVVIDANRERANETAGLFNQIGFETVTAATGREGFTIAAERDNVALVVVNANVIRLPLSQTVANIRADARTAQIPIVIYGPESVRSEIRGLLAHYPEIEYLIESSTVPNVELQVGRFLKRSLALAASPADQHQRVVDATAWLASIANRNKTDIFNLDQAEPALTVLATDRALFANAMAALAAIPTSSVQRQFEQIAVSERLDPEIREAAARHLALHIQQHGLLLLAAEAAQLEAAWRTAQSPALSTALAAAVGSLQPNARRVGDRLQRVPAPTRPTP